MHEIADALRNVTARMQRALEAGQRSRHIDAEDLIDVLLAVADEINPPFEGPPVCPNCGAADPDRPRWRADEAVR